MQRLPLLACDEAVLVMAALDAAAERHAQGGASAIPSAP